VSLTQAYELVETTLETIKATVANDEDVKIQELGN
jgi:nucleoid DNA-binding protein